MRRKAAVFYMYIASLGVFLLIMVTVWSYRVKKTKCIVWLRLRSLPYTPFEKQNAFLLLMSHLRWCVLGNYNSKGGNRAGNIDFLETKSEDSRDLSFFRETVGGKGNFSINWKFTLLNLVPSAFPLKNGSGGRGGRFPAPLNF